MNFKNKRILITAGPTWVAIDSVRVISNIATGRTGILLAQNLQDLGAKVTLVLGPTESCCLNQKIRLIRFKFFEDLRNIINDELRSKKYNILIHSAAVSDYRPALSYCRKVSSDRKLWRLDLVPTVKIIDLIKKIDSSIFLVGFKFEPGASKQLLLKKVRSLMNRAKLDLTVANSFHNGRYMAYILSKNKTYGVFKNKTCLTRELIKIIGDSL